MKIETFLRILDILEKEKDLNAPAYKLKNAYKRNPYTILMTTLLSLRSKDENTYKVVKKLFNKIQTPKELLEIEQKRLEEIIRPIGMYKQKAKTLREVSSVLIEKFNSQVPATKEELLSIKGIGEKTANIVLNNAFEKGVIAVDTHVHRLCNMWEVIKTKDEKESSKVLNEIIPKGYRAKLNFKLVVFGQTICLLNRPKCEECQVIKYCNKAKYFHPFSPLIDDKSEVLILGTFPSIKSFEDNFYYAHPQNQFWRLLSGVFDTKVPQSNTKKKEFLKKHHIALWDMIKSCKRENSLDSNLKEIEPNDIEALLKKYPNIKKVCFTSKKAQKIYEKNFSHLSTDTYYLLSPSPAYAVMKFEDKLKKWREVFENR